MAVEDQVTGRGRAGEPRPAPQPPSGGRLALVLSIVVVLGGASAIYAWSTLNRVLMGQGTIGEALSAVGAVLVVVALVSWLVRYLAPLAPPQSDA